MKTVEDYLDLPYKFETVQEPDGSFFISVKELEGCMTAADTIEEAFVMIKDAMQAWISIALEDCQEIPEPEVFSSEKVYSGKFVIRTPKSLHKELVEKAEENEVSLNSYAVSLLSRRCGIIEIKDGQIKSLNSLLIGGQKDYNSNGYAKVPFGEPVGNVIRCEFASNSTSISEERREN